MEDAYVAALAINLSLGFCFICCLRLFSCCIKYSGALREFFDPDADVSEQADMESSPYAATSLELENIRRLRMLKDQQIAGSRRLWLPRSIYAYVTLVSLFVDSSAFAAFSFTTVTDLNSKTTDNAAGTFTDIVRRIAKAFLLEFSDTSYSWTFWIATGVAWFTVIVGIYVLIKDSRTNSLPAIIFQICGMVLLFPICTTLMSVLSCRYWHHGDIPPVLAVLPSVTCWQSEHTRMVVVGVITFIMYYIVDALLLARLIRSIIDSDDLAVKEGENAVYTDNGFTVSYFQAKVLISFVVSYWGIGSYSPWIVMVFIFTVLVCLILYSIRTRPSNVDVLNSIRIYSFVFSLVVNICAILSMVSARVARLSHWLVFAGVLAWMVLTLTHFCSQYGWLECRVFEPKDDGAFSETLAEAAAFYEPLSSGGATSPGTTGATTGVNSPRNPHDTPSGRGSPSGRTTTYYHVAPPGPAALRAGLIVTSASGADGPVVVDLPVPNFVTGVGTERYEAIYGKPNSRPAPTPQSQAQPQDQDDAAGDDGSEIFSDGDGESVRSLSTLSASCHEETMDTQPLSSYVDISSGIIQDVSDLESPHTSRRACPEAAGASRITSSPPATTSAVVNPSNTPAGGQPNSRRRGPKQIVYVNLSSNSNDSIVLL